MTEYLFKLKRNGKKTVGYLKLADGWTQFQVLGRNDWYYPCDMKWTSAHPFVTKDKHGKDVFVGDKAFAKIWMEDLPIHRIVGEIIYYNCGYCIQTPTTYYHLNDLKDIELIEDRENEDT